MPPKASPTKTGGTKTVTKPGTTSPSKASSKSTTSKVSKNTTSTKAGATTKTTTTKSSVKSSVKTTKAKSSVTAKTAKEGASKGTTKDAETVSDVEKGLAAAKIDDGAPEDVQQSLTVVVKDLGKVLIKDEGNTIKKSGKWPLVVDHTGVAATFLKYQHTNVLCAMDPSNMEPERIRMALLGAIRFGKPFVLDFMNGDMYNGSSVCFDQIQTGLLDSILDKSLLKDKSYFSLIRDTDGDEYSHAEFNKFQVEMLVENFSFILITSHPVPSPELTNRMLVINVTK